MVASPISREILTTWITNKTFKISKSTNEEKNYQGSKIIFKYISRNINIFKP